MADTVTLWLLGPALIAVLLLLSAFFSSAETAIFSLSKVQVQRLRDHPTLLNRAILGFVDSPRRLLITSLIGNNLVNTAFTTLVTSITLRVGFRLAWPEAITLSVAMAGGTLLLLLFGEIAPKTFALQNAERVSRWIALPLSATSWALMPVRWAVRTIVDRIVHLLGLSGAARPDRVTEEEIRQVVSSGEATGSIEEEERQLIDRIVELRQMMAKDIMVPRTEMVCVEQDRSVGEAFQVALSVGHSRIPVYSGGVDNIVGILHVKDFPLWHRIPIEDVPLRDLITRQEEFHPAVEGTLIRPPLYLPETKRLDALLRDFAEEGTQMAILLDEYGGTAGLITLEDIIEEVVGEIMDEYDELIEPELSGDLDPHVLREEGVQLPAKLSLRTAGRLLQTTFDTDVADTLGGYVYSLFGRVPSVRETVGDDNGFEFQVTAMTGTRIQKVLVRRVQSDEDHPVADGEHRS